VAVQAAAGDGGVAVAVLVEQPAAAALARHAAAAAGGVDRAGVAVVAGAGAQRGARRADAAGADVAHRALVAVVARVAARRHLGAGAELLAAHPDEAGRHALAAVGGGAAALAAHAYLAGGAELLVVARREVGQRLHHAADARLASRRVAGVGKLAAAPLGPAGAAAAPALLADRAQVAVVARVAVLGQRVGAVEGAGRAQGQGDLGAARYLDRRAAGQVRVAQDVDRLHVDQPAAVRHVLHRQAVRRRVRDDHVGQPAELHVVRREVPGHERGAPGRHLLGAAQAPYVDRRGALLGRRQRELQRARHATAVVPAST